MSAFDLRRTCNATTKAGHPCWNRVKPGSGRCGQHQHVPVAEPIGYEGGYPVLAAVRHPARRRGDCDVFVADCPFCGATHTHGAEDGHRVAHCDWPSKPERGYIMREVEVPS